MASAKLSLKEIQKVQYDILCNIVDYMDQNQITYFLCGGTLLGAIRHNGFIPWDDDIDIFVPREDYEKLKELVRAGKYNHEYYSVKLPGDEGYGQPFIKVLDDRTYIMDETLNHEFKMSVNIDIFPFDHMPDNKHFHYYNFMKNRILRAALATKLVEGGINRNAVVSTIAKCVYHVIGGYRKVALAIDNHARKMNERNIKSHYAGDGPWPENMKDYYEVSQIYPLRKHIFVDREFNVPNDYDAFLRNFYGDYMTPPPEGQRARHFFTAYWKEDHSL